MQYPSINKGYRMLLLFILSCGFIFLPSCSLFNEDSSKVKTIPYISCNTNSDCVLVDKSCCGCNMGGESIAIHKSQENSYNNNLRSQCSSELMKCSAWYRCEQFQAQCHNSKCIVIQPDE